MKVNTTNKTLSEVLKAPAFAHNPKNRSSRVRDLLADPLFKRGILVNPIKFIKDERGDVRLFDGHRRRAALKKRLEQAMKAVQEGLADAPSISEQTEIPCVTFELEKGDDAGMIFRAFNTQKPLTQNDRAQLWLDTKDKKGMTSYLTETDCNECRAAFEYLGEKRFRDLAVKFDPASYVPVFNLMTKTVGVTKEALLDWFFKEDDETFKDARKEVRDFDSNMRAFGKHVRASGSYVAATGKSEEFDTVLAALNGKIIGVEA